MTCLVTGGTGFIGGALVRALVEHGKAVRVLIRPSSDLWRLEGLNVETVTGDVTKPSTLPAAVDGVETVYHLAGKLGAFGVPESVYRQIHVEGTLNLLRACVGQPVERFVLGSSPGMLGVLGPGEPPRDETSPHRPIGPYERSKSEAEYAACPLAAELGIPLIMARPEFVYGPGDTHVWGLFRSVQRGQFFFMGSREVLCHPTYIDDVVRGLLACASPAAQPGAVHFCGPQPVTMAAFVTAIAQALDVRPPYLCLPRWAVTAGAWGGEQAARLLGIQPPLSLDGVRFFSQSRAFTTDKAQRELGWQAEVDIEKGTRLTVAWYREQGMLN